MKNKQFHLRVADSVLRQALRVVPSSKLTERIALWWGYRFQPPPAVIKLRSGALLQTTHVDHLQLLLYYTGTFEEHCLQAMRDRLGIGSCVLDVGANIGLFTIEAGKAIGPEGHVIAIEALPSHAETVRRNLALNRLNNAEVVNVAVGESVGQATLTLPMHSNFGGYTLGNVKGSESVCVPVQRIDDIVGDRHVDFIKMDIEGSELRALNGAQKVLASKPAVLIELNDPALRSCGTSSGHVKRLLYDFGYEGVVLQTGQQVALDQEHFCDECLFI